MTKDKRNAVRPRSREKRQIAPGHFCTRVLSFVVALIMAMLAGCGPRGGDAAPAVVTVVVEQIVIVTGEPTLAPPEDPAEAPSPARTPRPTRTAAPTHTPGPTKTARPTHTPRPSPTPKPDLQTIVAAMAPVVAGEGVPAAAMYDPGASGPHRLVILESSGAGHPWNEKALVAWWKPWTVSETELVVVLDERKVSVESQEYGATFPITVHRCRLDLDVQVRSARTGSVVLTTTLEGPEPERFPIRVTSGTKEILGSPVPYEDLEDWLACQVGLGACLRPVRRLEGHSGGVECVAISPDGQTLASGSKDTTVRLWRVSDGTLLRALQGPADTVNGVGLAPDGQTLAAASRDGSVHLWRVADGALLHKLEGHTKSANSVNFSPDGQILASGADDTLRLWRVSDGSLIHTLRGHTGGVSSVRFSPDGETLASGSYDDTVRLWRVNDGALLRTLTGHTKSVTSLAFSPDGETLATGSYDGTARLWRVSNGATLRVFDGGAGPVWSIAFAPDGQTLAAYSGPSAGVLPTPRVRLWRLADGALLRTLRFPEDLGTARETAFAPDWGTLALALPEWAVRLWQIEGSWGD